MRYIERFSTESEKNDFDYPRTVTGIKSSPCRLYRGVLSRLGSQAMLAALWSRSSVAIKYFIVSFSFLIWRLVTEHSQSCIKRSPSIKKSVVKVPTIFITVLIYFKGKMSRQNIEISLTLFHFYTAKYYQNIQLNWIKRFSRKRASSWLSNKLR